MNGYFCIFLIVVRRASVFTRVPNRWTLIHVFFQGWSGNAGPSIEKYVWYKLNRVQHVAVSLEKNAWNNNHHAKIYDCRVCVCLSVFSSVLRIMLKLCFTRLALLKEVPIIQDRDERIELMNINKGIGDVFFGFQKAIGTYGK